jgi:glucose 1-dehydrogenase
MKLDNKRALVTGADSGIGQAIAELFAKEGADVAIVYHTDADGAAETKRRVEAAGRRALVMRGDVGDPDSVRRLFEQAATEFGGLDVLVNNAGTSADGDEVAEMKDEDLEKVLRVNLMGPLFCARAFIRIRRANGGSGRIVNVSSVAQHLPTPESASYGMAKAGLGSLCRSLSRELAGDRINVNNIAPGLIETPMTQDRVDDPEALEKSLARIPWGRVGQPKEIARVALFLASDDGDYVTGQTWTMDGGLTMQWGGA